MERLSDDELQGKTEEFKHRYQNGETVDDFIRKLLRLFVKVQASTWYVSVPVQLMGGAALHEGNIAEMKTGEGKTLTSTMPVYLNALTGKGVHVVTVNEYLANRDASEMGQLYAFLGLTVGLNLK